MFSKKPTFPERVEAEHARLRAAKEAREDQMGPKPDPKPAPELRQFEAVLRHGMPSVTVKAHSHNFGIVESSCDYSARGVPRRGLDFTHFVVYGETTWVQAWKDTGAPGGQYSWAESYDSNVVYSIRTNDIIMVADKGFVADVPVITLEAPKVVASPYDHQVVNRDVLDY